ncbi:MAG: DUF3108 domain-containing protein [Proteobacteria bacterium]|nr:DUF3108 domain-containing protein [Pseudomonadota bacterium]
MHMRHTIAVLTVFALFSALPASVPAHAREARAATLTKGQEDGMSLSYNVYAGGFRALRASLALDMEQKEYKVGLNAKTEGFIGKLFPWAGKYETSGTKQQDTLKPAEYESTSIWKDEEKQTRLEFKNGLLKTRYETETGHPDSKTDIEADLAKDAVDMLTGAVTLLQQTNGEDSCEGTVPVFDGKRRYNLHFKDAGQGTIYESRYSLFHGEALKCIIEVEPVAGFSKRDQKRGWLAIQNHTKERKKMPTVWLSRLKEGGPVVPVRMEISSSYGAVIAHLAGVQ